jgi:hypothetical protein
MNVNRVSALICAIFFGVGSIGGDGCFNAAPKSNTPLETCPAGQQCYKCTVQARVTEVVPSGDGNAISTQCCSPPASCWHTNQEAQDQAAIAAQAALHDHMTGECAGLDGGV